MRARDIVRRINRAKCDGDKACFQTRQVGSHIRFDCRCHGQTCRTSVPDHGSKDLGIGLLHGIEADLEPCLGKGWLNR